MKRFFSILTTTGFLVASAQAAIVFNIEAPGVQERVGGTFQTIDFNSETLGSTYNETYNFVGGQTATYAGGNIILSGLDTDYPIGSLTDDWRFGGADRTRYISVGVQSGNSEYSITLSENAFYFGFFWGAGDAQNEILFYDSLDNLIESFTVFDIVNHPDFINQDFYGAALGGLFPSPPNPAGSGHRGNPNYDPTANRSEPYAFLNFTADVSTPFRKILIRNNSTSVSGFETDNHTFSFEPIDVVPEPATFGLAGMALLALGMKLRKRS